MVILNESMLERYEIVRRRPAGIRAALIGTDTRLLGCAARALDDKHIGAACIGSGVERLNEQDGMFTEIIRGNGTRTERVVQSILRADTNETLIEKIATAPEAEFCIMRENASDVDYAYMIALIRRHRAAQVKPPMLFVLSERADRIDVSRLRRIVGDDVKVVRVLEDHMCGRMSASERAITERTMNYSDAFLMWAEEKYTLTADTPNPLFPGDNFAQTCERKCRIFDAIAFMTASIGYLCGKDTFAEAMGDEQIRGFVAHAFYDELMPRLPWRHETITENVIQAFVRLSEPMNACPLLSRRRTLSDLPDTLLPALRSCAEKGDEMPPKTTLAIAAGIMLCSGARYDDEAGTYVVQRGEKKDIITDDPSFLEAFTRLAHDMPAESLAYAVLADREMWGADLREIEGLEARLTEMLSLIGRVGMRESMRLVSGE